jgi:hypothetical protein
MAYSGGWNPRYGMDTGPRPPIGLLGGQMMQPGHTYIPHQSINAGLYGGYSSYGEMYPTVVPAGAWPAPAHLPQHIPYHQPRYPQPTPKSDPRMPAAQMTNSMGGVGCEPGYNYFFPPEHTKVHVFRSSTPPWQLPPNAQIPFTAAHVPSNTTLHQLLIGFGCNNPVAKKNRGFEVVQGGNGKWYKGLSFGGDDKDMMKKTLTEVGWNVQGSGAAPVGQSVVWLWMVKD